MSDRKRSFITMNKGQPTINGVPLTEEVGLIEYLASGAWGKRSETRNLDDFRDLVRDKAPSLTEEQIEALVVDFLRHLSTWMAEGKYALDDDGVVRKRRLH